MKSLASLALLIVLAFGSASSFAQLTPPNVPSSTILPEHTRHVVTALIDVHAQVVASDEDSSDEPSLSSTDPVFTIPTFTSQPNPFVGSTSVSYSLQRAGRVDMEIYDIHGRVVSQPLADIDRPAGEHNVGINAAALAPGVYFCRLSVDGSSRVIRLVHE